MSLAQSTSTPRFISPEIREAVTFRLRCETVMWRLKRDLVGSDAEGPILRWIFRSREAAVCARALLIDAGLIAKGTASIIANPSPSYRDRHSLVALRSEQSVGGEQ